MKNVILYYYNLNNISLTRYKNKILVKNDNDFYWFELVENIDEVKRQYELTKNQEEYYDFVPNKEKSIFTRYKDNYYVLLKVKENKGDILDRIIKPIEVDVRDEVKLWKELWIRKSDFIEYQMKHIANKYKTIDESIDYYIGLIEVSIQYLSYNEKKQEEKRYLVHKRIDKRNFYNPLNVKVDIKERDLAGYLKLLFMEEDYTEDDISRIIDRANLSFDERIRLFARLLFPSYYLDVYDLVVSCDAGEDELKKVILRNEEYELFLRMIFKLLNKKNDMPYIHFLNL